jgi:hypothetical protein
MFDPFEHLNGLPSSLIDLELEFSYEHLKLIYIGDIKMLRLKWGCVFLSLTLFTDFYIFVRYYLMAECGP